MLHSRVVNKGQLLEEEQFDPVGGRYSISQPETRVHIWTSDILGREKLY